MTRFPTLLTQQCRRRLRASAPLAALLLLAACATTPTPTAPPVVAHAPEADTRAPVLKPSPAPTLPAAKRPGAYYQDDGPDDHPPPNLDAVPEPQPRAEPLIRAANAPYNVFGKDYVPATELKPYTARGVASWYGRKFHGQRTSSGETYDMYGMTAAHPTLPIPSYARVTNAANGKSVIVRINDRGPFHSSRIMDLSYTAAYKLGFVSQGSAQVDIEALIPEGVEMLPSHVAPIAQRGRPTRRAAPAVVVAAPPPATPDPIVTLASAGDLANAPAAAPPAPAAALPAPVAEAPAEPAAAPQPQARGVFLQLGAFATASNAEGFRGMVAHDLAWLADKLAVLRLGDRFRLHAGPFASDAEARSAANRIASALRLKPFIVR